MRFFFELLVISVSAAAVSMGADPADNKGSSTTKATYLVTGLHCPPCTKTVELSLARIQGVRSVKVDWKTKSAQVEFDEMVLPAQTLAQRIASTSHMMGGSMRYGGWLALKVPAANDQAIANEAKATLGKLAGVKQVVVYPQHRLIGVQFDAKGKLKSEELISALQSARIEASNP
ncbi:MAG: heavy metal-associated domain-containing protein [Pirellulales bacterium]